MAKLKGRAAVAMAALGMTALGTVAFAQDAVVTDPEGIPPEETIAARRALMMGIDALMYEIEAAVPADLDELELYTLQQHYLAIGGMLLAFPNLFPADTNLPEPAVAEGGHATVALPFVWESFQAFHNLAHQAADVALGASMAASAADLATTAADLRAVCDACHSQFMEYRAPF